MLSAQLVEYLSDGNAWYRETAQRLLVERNNIAAVVPLRNLAQRSDNPLARIHALWTLDGMHRLDAPRIRLALADPDPRVRAQAIRLAEPILTSPQREDLFADVVKLVVDQQPHVRLQFVLTVSGIGVPAADAIVAEVLHKDAHNQYIRDAAISGMRGRELALLETISTDPAWSAIAPGRAELCEALARAVMTEGSPKRVARLLDLAAVAAPPWRQSAVLGGASIAGKSKFARRQLVLPAEPSPLLAIEESHKEIKTLLTYIAWPGKPGYVPPPPPKPLTTDQQARFESGQQLYAKTCIQCHKADGLGQEGLAPPLVNSDWVLGPDHRLARIVLHGMRGPVHVDGKTFNLDMPSWSTLNDDQLASILTYVRRSWDHGADAIDPPLLKTLREQNAARSDAWTERELLRIK